ncbi:hypothetical protein DFQ04_0074 [Algoriphagus boseongensis]|uniref:Uncharacterized protein n=1 Tax=Algoriphagus boseongensis TaxID=1442587 RepID=A0A4R6T6P5_9BACT|nr:hypothetical protein [Algoriphagus boseongensis]TDQ18276.1 hypothetical protein DFQ04_0074 [Algoriphagus boseongensis]
MNPILKNFAAVLVGLLVGATVNMGLILISGSIIPPPEGADLTTMEGLTAAMPLMEPKHFLFPFLAHALGTLVGAFLTAKIAASYKWYLAMFIGLMFFIGGTINVMSLPAPLWFNVVDLLGAYFPMAFIGASLAGAKRTSSPKTK